MSEEIPPGKNADEGASPEGPHRDPPEPPPLDTIRVRGPRARGLNKPAILAAAGGSVAVVMLLASGVFSSDPARRPTDVKPMMSDPARPEMARGAIRSLPADYAQAAAQAAAEPPPPTQISAPQPIPPQLGPPLPGDVAAFGPPHQPLYPDHDYGEGWTADASDAVQGPEDPAAAEAATALRAGLFFDLRETPRQDSSASAQHPTSQGPQRSPLTAIAPQAPDLPARAPDTGRSLFPGTVIPASLLTELNSESPGPVIAQVTQAIHDSATGRTLLIPQGARLVGDYRSSTRYGQSRIAIVWSRLIMPNGDELMLDETAVGPSGAAGVTGEVDNHWGDVFGAAMLGTLINIGVATAEEPQLTYNGIGAVTRDPVDAALADGAQRTASTVTSRVVDRGLAIAPTIKVEAGKRISAIVTRRANF